jgi:UDP-3-O-[3-hydroxymyristoyl] N-acetylglucosamine deacetylase / 3-hydroxyacyl-[acyl-carrier-protein] dehydratase
MENQKTIAKECVFSGVGLHTGNAARMVFKPAGVDTGIVFVRTDLPGTPRVRACVDNLLSSSVSLRRTSIGVNGAEVQTIEHLMAAFAGLGIDNIVVEINNNEIPGMDGSSLVFIEEMKKAGFIQQDKERIYFSLKEPVTISEGTSTLIALPSSDFKLSYTLDYSNHPVLKSSFLEVAMTPELFGAEFAAARTFCLEEEANSLKSQGMGLGANYDNTLVVGKGGVIKNKLRFDNEFIRHKLLDLIGDLYLAGPVQAHVIALKSGHSLNLSLAKKINQQRSAAGGHRRVVSGLPEGSSLNIEQIMGILPHREPFLFVDRITHIECGKRAVGIKNVTINDYFFKGHFPGRPVMPGVIMLEAMAQVGGVMMLASEEHKGKLALFMAADKVKFRKTVMPGDQLVMEVVAGKIKARTGQVFAKAQVDGKVVCEAEFMFAIIS